MAVMVMERVGHVSRRLLLLFILGWGAKHGASFTDTRLEARVSDSRHSAMTVKCR